MDILDAIVVAMPCSACSGEYEVTLRQALLSHESDARDCSVRMKENARHSIGHASSMNSLRVSVANVWSRLEDEARQAGGELTLVRK